MSTLGDYIQRAVNDHNIEKPCAMPEWEFVIVMGKGFFDNCAGVTRNGVYYSEHQLLAAYHQRNPDAEPLI